MKLRIRQSAAGVGTALCYASSPVLVRFGLREGGSPLLAVTFGLLVATVAYLLLDLFLRRRERGLSRSEGGSGRHPTKSGLLRGGSDPDLGPTDSGHPVGGRAIAYLFQFGAAVAIGLGTWFRYIALDVAPLALVATLIRINIIVVLILTPLLLPGHRHRITPKTLAGAGMIIAGTVLVSLG